MTARARNTDRETSHLAADSVKGITDTKHFILKTFEAFGPMTDEKLVENYNKLWRHIKRASDSGIRSRRRELEVAGFIVQIERFKGTTEAGNKAAVFGLAGVLF